MSDAMSMAGEGSSASSRPRIQLRPIEFPKDRDAFLGLICPMYSSIPLDLIHSRLDEVCKREWDGLGAFAGEDFKEMVGMTGFWVHSRIFYGRYLYVDHFVVAPGRRQEGIGQLMIAELERIAVDRKCERVVLDAFSGNTAAHKFWMNRGYAIAGFHFNKETVLSAGVQRATPEAQPPAQVAAAA